MRCSHLLGGALLVLSLLCMLCIEYSTLQEQRINKILGHECDIGNVSLQDTCLTKTWPPSCKENCTNVRDAFPAAPRDQCLKNGDVNGAVGAATRLVRSARLVRTSPLPAHPGDGFYCGFQVKWTISNLRQCRYCTTTIKKTYCTRTEALEALSERQDGTSHRCKVQAHRRGVSVKHWLPDLDPDERAAARAEASWWTTLWIASVALFMTVTLPLTLREVRVCVRQCRRRRPEVHVLAEQRLDII